MKWDNNTFGIFNFRAINLVLCREIATKSSILIKSHHIRFFFLSPTFTNKCLIPWHFRVNGGHSLKLPKRIGGFDHQHVVAPKSQNLNKLTKDDAIFRSSEAQERTEEQCLFVNTINMILYISRQPSPTTN